MGDRIDDAGSKARGPDRPLKPIEDRLGEVLPLGDLVEDVLAVDLLARVLGVVLVRGDPVVGDGGNGRAAERS